jgi:hypothetical protein
MRDGRHKLKAVDIELTNFKKNLIRSIGYMWMGIPDFLNTNLSFFYNKINK